MYIQVKEMLERNCISFLIYIHKKQFSKIVKYYNINSDFYYKKCIKIYKYIANILYSNIYIILDDRLQCRQ